jgi:hypothetical protein
VQYIHHVQAQLNCKDKQNILFHLQFQEQIIKQVSHFMVHRIIKHMVDSLIQSINIEQYMKSIKIITNKNPKIVYLNHHY